MTNTAENIKENLAEDTEDAKAGTGANTGVNQESHEFNAEVGKVLQLVIHSLYTNKEIFLRELISNSSDACDKLRYLAVTKPEFIKDDAELKIQVTLDKDKKTITVADNGIGMSKQELLGNLGTIARSGTQEFLKKITEDKSDDTALIGQFGVGFYSGFMVAEKVRVESRKAGEKEGYIWESAGDGKFTIAKTEEDISRGTKIILHIKEAEKEFLDKFRLSHIIRTYSDHISFPVELKDLEDGKSEIVNSASALWLKPKSEIKPEQYKEFYHHVAHQGDEPWMILHNKVEGTIEYTNLLFIPGTKPFDLFHPDRKTRVKLYVKRVFITEDYVDLIPQYLRFLRGVVDSEDLPLNISRESLQNNTVVLKIRQSLVKKVLSELGKKAEKEPEEYAKFWENFGAVLKEGLCESLADAENLLKVCRFKTSLHPEKLNTLDEYISRMQDGQKYIYYYTGDNSEKMQESPALEGFKSKNIEVLLLDDHVDDFWVTVQHKYQDKELKSITRADIDLDKADKDDGSESDAKKTEVASKETEDTPAEIDKLIKLAKGWLGDKVKEVKISKKLVESPVCLSTPEGSLDARMEKFLYEQKQLPTRAAKIFEINPNHSIIKGLANKIDDNGKVDNVKDAVLLLFDQATIIQGDNIPDASGFSSRINKLLEKSLIT